MDNKFREVSEKIRPYVSDKAKQAIDNINDAFDEAQSMINNAENMARFAQGKPPKGMAYEHLGIVHGKEFVMSSAEHKSKRDLLEKHYEGKYVTRSMGDDDDIVIDINVPE